MKMDDKRQRILSLVVVPIILIGILFVCAKYAGHPEEGQPAAETPASKAEITVIAQNVTPSVPLPTPADTTPAAKDVTPQPTEVAAPTPKPTEIAAPSPKPTQNATPVPTQTQKATPVPKVTLEPERTEPEPVNPSVPVFDVVHYDEPFEVIEQTAFYLRKEPGRTGERIVFLPVGTIMNVTYSCTNKFHEPWYGVSVVIDETEYTGFVQASATQLGTTLKWFTTTSALLDVPCIESPSGTLGPDRNGDGIYVVVLDPGHGGVFSGASHYGVNEKEINLKVARYCKQYLESNYTNVKVYLTRSGDYVFDALDDTDDLEYRARYAIDRGADLVLSLHFNAYDGKQRGAMVLMAKKALTYEKERMFASYLLEEMENIGIGSAGIKRKESQVTKYLDGTPMDGYLMTRLPSEVGIPSCIIEHCFMDNRYDRVFWDTEEKLARLGQGDALAIARFLALKEVEQEEQEVSTEPEEPKEPEDLEEPDPLVP